MTSGDLFENVAKQLKELCRAEAQDRVAEQLQINIAKSLTALALELMSLAEQPFTEPLANFCNEMQHLNYLAQTAPVGLYQHFLFGRISTILELAAMIRHAKVPKSTFDLVVKSPVAITILQYAVDAKVADPTTIIYLINHDLGTSVSNIEKKIDQLVALGILQKDQFGQSARLSPAPLAKAILKEFKLGL